MPDDFDSILDDAEALTDNQLSGRISSLVRLTDAEIEELFPSTPDRKHLTELMKIVRASTDINTRRQHLVDNIESLSSTVIKLIGKLA